MNRRNWIAGGVASSALASQAKLDKIEIPKRIFGKTGEKLTVIGQAGGRFPLISFAEAKEVTRHAYNLGVNYFDCAHSYWDGRSEEVFGEALTGIRKKIFLTTKTTRRDNAGAMNELELSLKRLKTDYVDLWQIHSVGKLEDVEKIFAPGGAIEAFEAAKQKGLCRFIGFTGHHDPEVHLAMLRRYDKYDTILMPLHAADPAYLSFEKTVLPEAVKRGLGIQAMKSTANAKLLQTLSVRQCIEYSLSLPVHCLALGCTTIGQLEDDVRIAKSLTNLSELQLTELRNRVTRAKIHGPRLEDWKKDTTLTAGLQKTYTGA